MLSPTKRNILYFLAVLSILFLLWNVASFLFDIPRSVPARICYDWLPEKDVSPVDLQINYVAAYMVGRVGYPHIYDYMMMQRTGYFLGLEPYVFHYPATESLPLFLRYVSTPFSICLYLPLVLFPFGTAYALWIVCSSVLLSAALAILLRGKSLPFVAFALLCASLFQPIQFDMMLGQTNLILLFLFVLFIFLLQKKRDIAASAVLALLVQIKMLPAIFALFFLKKRRVRFLLLSLLFFGLFSLIPFLILGKEPLIFFTETVAPRISSGNFHFINQGLYGFVGRLFYVKDGIYPEEGAGGMLDSRAGYVAKPLSAVMLLVVWFLTKREYRVKCLLESNEISLYVLTMILISPVAWFHYFTLTIIPFFTLLADLTEDGKKSIPTAFFFVACFSAMNFFPLHWTGILVDLKFFVLTALWIFFAVRLWREGSSPDAVSETCSNEELQYCAG